MRCDTRGVPSVALMITFQSTHPVWGATSRPSGSTTGCAISIHAPRVGCDTTGAKAVKQATLFQSTHPVWGATWRRGCHEGAGYISIHAPRVGCDDPEMYHLLGAPGISIHAPRVGCDGMSNKGTGRTNKFQSTHPVWGATVLSGATKAAERHFNPRTPCGVRHQTGGASSCTTRFQSRVGQECRSRRPPSH